MPIEEFTISNTSAIKFVECKNSPKLMIIAGPNGVGKSTLLETISNSLNGVNPSNTNIRIGKINSPIAVYIAPHRSPISSPMHKAIASSLPTFTYSQTLSKNLYYIGGYGIPELHPYFSQPLNRSKSEPDFIPLFEVKARLINFENQYNKFLAIAFS